MNKPNPRDRGIEEWFSTASEWILERRAGLLALALLGASLWAAGLFQPPEHLENKGVYLSADKPGPQQSKPLAAPKGATARNTPRPLPDLDVDPDPDGFYQGSTAPYDPALERASLENALAGGEDESKRALSLEERLSAAVKVMGKRGVLPPGTPSLMPVRDPAAYISGGFGWRTNPVTGEEREFHAGLDIAGEYRSPVVAAADGQVTLSMRDTFLGECVKISHPGGYSTLYGHLAKRIVKEGGWLKKGDLLGFMGNTGRSTGTHLHYSVEKGGRYLDPTPFIWEGLSLSTARRN